MNSKATVTPKPFPLKPGVKWASSKSEKLTMSGLTLFQMTNLRLFQTERVCRREF